jgi:hypothetical protein
VINCSTVEHVGLAGRYGIKEDMPDADFRVMALLRALMKDTGRMLLTIPVGREAVIRPLHRVYGKERLKELLSGYEVIQTLYWAKDAKNRWILSDDEIVFSVKPGKQFYCLGCYVLGKGEG